MKKHSLLFKLAFILFCVSFAVLVTAMILHAVGGDESDAAVAAAIISVGISGLGLLFACIKLRDKNEEEVNCDGYEEN